MCFVPTRYFTKISYITVIRAFPVVNVISFSPLDQQLLRFSPLLDHVTKMTSHLFKSVQFDFDDGHLTSGFGIELLPSFDIAR